MTVTDRDTGALGKELVAAWRKDGKSLPDRTEAPTVLSRRLLTISSLIGILQIQFPPGLQVLSDAIKQSKSFFAQQHEAKAKCVDSQSFAGYIA